jgi:hypothetical protein
MVVFLGWALLARFDATATVDYRFEYKRVEHNLTLAIPLAEYRAYKEKLRPEGFAEYRSLVANPYVSYDTYAYFSRYRAMATDPGDETIIGSLVRQLNETAAAMNLDGRDKVELILRFVQSLDYTPDLTTTPYFDEYPRYPVETLFDQEGDCEDTSILLAAILSEMGYDVALILFEKLDHMGLGIYFPEEAGIEMYGNSWIVDDGRRYWYLDTSGNRTIGWAPEPYGATSAYVYPLAG